MAQRLDKRMRPQISPCISSFRVVRGDRPRGNFEKEECRKSHLRSLCNAIKVSNLRELGLFADVSEEKVPIYSMLLNVLVSRWSRVRSSRPAILSWRFGHEKILRPFSPFRCFRRAVISYWRKNVH